MRHKQKAATGSYIPITSKDPSSIVSEQYRKLRTNIELSNFNDEIKVIGLTSTFAQEGKTITSVNLATVYAQSEMKTLLIDMDLRSPKVHRGFKLINDIGLSDIISKNLDPKNVIHQIDDHLSVLTTGSKLPFPAEFLMSQKLKDLVEKFKNEYDRIIIDTPPMTAVADASIIGSLCSGMILVIKAKETETSVVKNDIKDLEDNGVKIIGSVLTRVNIKDHRYMNYYYYSSKES